MLGNHFVRTAPLKKKIIKKIYGNIERNVETHVLCGCSSIIDDDQSFSSSTKNKKVLIIFFCNFNSCVNEYQFLEFSFFFTVIDTIYFTCIFSSFSTIFFSKTEFHTCNKAVGLLFFSISTRRKCNVATVYDRFFIGKCTENKIYKKLK